MDSYRFYLLEEGTCYVTFFEKSNQKTLPFAELAHFHLSLQ